MFFGKERKKDSIGIRKISAVRSVRPVQAVRAEEVSRAENSPADTGKVHMSSADRVHTGLSPEDIKRAGMQRDMNILRAVHLLAGFVCRSKGKESLPLLQKLLSVLHTEMRLHKEQQAHLNRSFLQGMYQKISCEAVAAKLRSYGGRSCVLCDICFDFTVYAALTGKEPDSKLLQDLKQLADSLGIDEVRLVHLMRLRQIELALKKKLGLSFRECLPKLSHIRDKGALSALKRYSLEVLGLEEPFTLSQAAAAAQLTVLRNAPVNLEKSGVPFALICFSVKNTADAIAAYRLLQSI